MKNSRLVWFIAGLAVLTLLVQAAHAVDIGLDSANYYPAPAKPGQSFDLWVHVKNNSNSNAEGVVFRLNLADNENNRTNYPFSLGADDSPIRNLGTILANQSALVKFNVLVDKAALNGNYDISAEMGDNSQYSLSTKISISVVAQNPQIELVGSPQIELSPGQATDTELILKNTGNAKAVDILVGTVEDRTVTSTGVVVERQISVLGPTQAYLNSIEVGSTASAKLSLVASSSAESKVYTIPIQLRWQDENGSSYSATRYIGVKVNVVPALDLVITSLKPEPLPGAKTEIGFNIYNAGPAAAKNVVVELSSNAADSISDSKIFIGTLESDDSTTFKSTFALKSGFALGNQPIEVKISYRDPQFRELTSVKTLYFSVSSPKEKEGASEFPWLAAIVIVAIAAAAIFLFQRKRKAKRK